MNKNSVEKSVNNLENKFNTIMISMLDHITEYYSDHKIKKIKEIAEEIIEKKPEEPISLFLYHIYRVDNYRTNILEGNDEFFINEMKEIKDKNIKKLFEFKNIWIKMDDESKEYIKKSMKGLVLISNKYIMLL